MGIVEQAFSKSDIKQDDLSPNMPEKGRRRNKDWATVIGTVRRLEQQDNEAQAESMARIEKLTADLAHWMERAHTAERQCERLMLKLKIIEGDFDEKNKTYLLANSSAEATA